MSQFQLQVEHTVVSLAAFKQRRSRNVTTRLNCRDKMDLKNWREVARNAGYDRMVVHDRDDGDATEVGDFLSVYRRGEAWSRWGFARKGDAVQAWCSLSWADMGQFDTLSHALETVLRVPAPAISDVAVMPSTLAAAGAVVTAFRPRLSQLAGAA